MTNTVNKVSFFNKPFRLGLTSQIAIALVLAIVVGYFMQGCSDVAKEYIKPVGTIFLNLLKFIVVPLVLLSIVTGILSMEDIRKVGRLGIKTVLYFTATTVIAVSLGLLLATCAKGFFPVIHIASDSSATQAPVGEISFMQQIVGMFPDNIIRPVSENAMMQIIVIAMFFGIAMVHEGEKVARLKDLCIQANHLVTRVLDYIMALAPIGIFCMLTPVVAENGPSVLSSFAVLICTDYSVFAIHAIMVYGVTVYLLGKCNPLRFFREMSPAMLFAFSSDSSVATLPYTISCSEKLGVRHDISSFVNSLGATIHMDGVAIYLGVTSVFIAHCAGIDLSMHQYLAIAMSSTIASIGTPGVPGGSLALMAMVLASAGLPVEGVALVAGIDRIVDMGRTTMSITGDAACAVIMQRFEGEEINK